MSIGTGFIKLHRAILNSEVFQNESLFKVWIWCLCRANYVKSYMPISTGRGGAVVTVGPGQFVFGRKVAALELGMTQSGIYKRMVKLKNMGNLDIKSNNKFSIITIVNWNTYQDCGENSNSKSNKEVTSKEQASNTSKEVKEVKKEKKTTDDTIVSSSAELEKNSSSPDQETPTEVFIFKIPLNDKTEFGITQKDYDKWQDTFPAVDVMAQLKRMALWCDDNPKNRKTSRGVRKFISSWLSKEQDRAQRVNPGFKKYDNAANIKKMMEELSDD